MIQQLPLIYPFLLTTHLFAQNVFSVEGNQTYLNQQPFQSIGLRCSNALLSEETVDDLISPLDEYKTYGLNTIKHHLTLNSC